MDTPNPTLVSPNQVLRRVLLAVAELPDQELWLVYEFVETLRHQASQPSVAQIRAQARQQAQQLQHLSTAERLARFETLSAAIRQQASERGTALEGEWEHD